MWRKARAIFEIFYDSTEPHLGYRVKVRESLPIDVTLKPQNNFFFGWCARVPAEASACSHLYERSPVRPNGYMGGPASYCNWARGDKGIRLQRPSRSTSRFLVRLECRSLCRGQELVWNYGFRKGNDVDLTGDTWFKEVIQ